MIEIFADIWCPFAYVGLTMVRQYRDEHAPAGVVRVRAWPLELVNGEPQSVDLAAEHVQELRSQLGVKLFSGFDPRTFPTTTLPALALVAAAEREGRGELAAFRLREALWEEGRDVGAPDVLTEVAVELGVVADDTDEQTVLADWHEGQSRGVQGSPHFFCGDTQAFCPSLQIEHDAVGKLHVAADPSRLVAFLEGCWP